MGSKLGVSWRDVGWGQQDPKFGVNETQNLGSMGPKLGVNGAKTGGQLEGYGFGSMMPKVWGH